MMIQRVKGTVYFHHFQDKFKIRVLILRDYYKLFAYLNTNIIISGQIKRTELKTARPPVKQLVRYFNEKRSHSPRAPAPVKGG